MSVTATDIFKDLGLATTADSSQKPEQNLGQEQFLQLLTTQLTHQDPLSPMESGDFLGQLAQFSTVSGIQDLQKSFSDFASSLSSDQALQASSLVGRDVFAPGNEALLNVGDVIAGNFELPDSSPNTSIKIINPLTDEVIKSINLGGHASGNVPFIWDGLNEQGELADPGVYEIRAEAIINGNNTILQTNLKSRVESINLGSGSRGLQVNLEGVDAVDFNQIKQIL